MGKVQDYPRGLTFEHVWAALQETRKLIEENARGLEESKKETDRQFKEYNKRFGDFSNRFGEIVEYMVAPNLQEKFAEMGLFFEETVRNKEIKSKDGQFLFEVDVMLENGDRAMLVETKTKPTTKDVTAHVKRLEKMRLYADFRGDKRKFLGGIAGVVMTKTVRDYALSKGLFAIEPSGETFNITAPKGKPGEW